MAVGTPTLLTPNVGATATSATTASFTPTANQIMFVAGGARPSGGSLPAISDNTGGVYTWTPLSAGLAGTAAKARMWWTQVGSSPSAMTVTITSTSATQTMVSVFTVSGIDDDFSNYNESEGDDVSFSLASMAGSSGALYFHVRSAGSVSTPATGYAEVYDAEVATNLRASLGYDLSSPGTTINPTSSSTTTVCMAFELKEAVASGAIAGSSSPTFSTSGTLRGAGKLAGTSTVAFSTSASGKAAVFGTGTSTVAFSTAGSLKGAGRLLGSSDITFSTSGILLGAGSLVGEVFQFGFTGSGSLLGAGKLAGTSTVAFTTSASGMAAVFAVGSTSFAFTTSGTLDAGEATIFGTSTVAFTTSGTLTGAGKLAGTSTVAFTTAGSLKGAGKLLGSTTVTFSTAADIQGADAGLTSGSSNFAFTTAGSLKGSGRLLGSSNVSFSLAGVLRGRANIAGTTTMTFTVSGDELTSHLSPFGHTSGVQVGTIYEESSDEAPFLYYETSGPGPDEIYEEN